MTRPFRALLVGALLIPGSLIAMRGAGAAGGGVTIEVDTAANRHPINPNIYGVAFASSAELAELNAPLNRSGGNDASRYNWQLNASNHGSDFYFESIADDSAAAGE